MKRSKRDENEGSRGEIYEAEEFLYYANDEGGRGEGERARRTFSIGLEIYYD